MFLDVAILTPEEVLFEGKASAIVVPGEEGVCEILPFHKKFLSRLISGAMIIDNKSLYIKRGVVKVNQNKVLIIVERQ
ncbi:MAG: hypothetical protein KAQ99_00960 [Candidatus Aureabacteria bacterium]|nr:hypothetical protein [Candidatus Auribacterota bacterium]